MTGREGGREGVKEGVKEGGWEGNREDLYCSRSHKPSLWSVTCNNTQHAGNTVIKLHV